MFPRHDSLSAPRLATIPVIFAQFDSARQDAQRQRLYLETIVEPNLADQALYPKRILQFFFVLGVSLCDFGLVKGFFKTVSEYQV